MIEKRTLWIVVSDEQIIESVAALYDTASNKVLTFKYNTSDYYSTPHKDTVFYETKEEAETALKERQKWLLDMMPKVKEFLSEIEDIKPTDDFAFERSDYLPYSLMSDSNYYYNRFKDSQKIISYLTTACRQQKLCINGCTFPISHVRRVNWYRGKAELELTDGSFGGNSSVTTCNKEELEVVQILFGDNTSNAYYNR
jgi:hypothetical protein